MYGFSLNNVAGEQMDPLQRFGSTQFGGFGSTQFGGFGSLPGASNGVSNGSGDSISPFGANGYGGWNGGNASGAFGFNSGSGLASMLGGFGSYVQNLFGQISQWIQNYSSQLQSLASGQGQTSGTSGLSPNGQYGNGQCASGQTGNGQCASGQTGNGQCANGQYGNAQYANGQYGNWQNGNGQYGNGQYGNASQNLGPQQFFTSANANSVGDPHDSFNGASSTNGNLNNRWDDMRSHGRLLMSDSFRGGYRVSTTIGQPNSNGATMNSSATVTTDNGNTSVTLNADGTSSVTKRGQPITLQTGTATNLGNGESVTLNADGSLTVQMQNQSGGTIATTLRANNGGVDVSDQAQNVDLGGYLVTQSEGAG